MRILCAGVSHKTAGLELREHLALDAAALRARLRELSRRWPDAEFAILSTCNRVELYVARPLHGHPREEELREALTEPRRAAEERNYSEPAAPAGVVTATGHRKQATPQRRRFSEQVAKEWGIPYACDSDAVYVLADEQAVRHILEVAAGLDSMVVGEAQIVAQVKDALDEARRVGATRGVLTELMQAALHTGKHVRSETALGRGKASVASAAVDFAARELGGLSGKRVLSVGAGKMNELMLASLKTLGAKFVTVVNRSAARARALADKCGGTTRDWSDLQACLADADLVLTSTAARRPIITADMLAAARKRRRTAPAACPGGSRHARLVVIDIAVPRDVEPAAGKLPGVKLVNIDGLRSQVRRTVRERKSQRIDAEKIVAAHAEEFMRRLGVRQIGPTIDKLYARMEEIAAAELSAAMGKLSTHADAEQDAAIIQRALHRTIRRIVHPVAKQLRDGAAEPGAGLADASALRRLFDLNDES